MHCARTSSSSSSSWRSLMSIYLSYAMLALPDFKVLIVFVIWLTYSSYLFWCLGPLNSFDYLSSSMVFFSTSAALPSCFISSPVLARLPWLGFCRGPSVRISLASYLLTYGSIIFVFESASSCTTFYEAFSFVFYIFLLLLPSEASRSCEREPRREPEPRILGKAEAEWSLASRWRCWPEPIPRSAPKVARCRSEPASISGSYSGLDGRQKLSPCFSCWIVLDRYFAGWSLKSLRFILFDYVSPSEPMDTCISFFWLILLLWFYMKSINIQI